MPEDSKTIEYSKLINFGIVNAIKKNMFEQKEFSLTACSLAAAIVGSLSMGILSILGLLGVGNPLIELLSSLFIGYGVGFSGLFVGMVWGFFAGSIAGLIFAWFYNKLLK